MEHASTQVIAELAPSGVLRVTINLGNVVLAQRVETTGALKGVSVDLARELASRLGVAIELFPFDTAGKAFAALKEGRCDVGFLAVDPVRQEELDFTSPYVIIEGTYLVPERSPLREIEDVDHDGVEIAAGRNTAYDLHLTRALQHARLVHAPSSQAAIDMLLEGGADATAGVRQPLAAAAAAHPGFRVMSGRFLEIRQAMAVPKGRAAGFAYMQAFIEDLKASGFVAAKLVESGHADATVAPAAEDAKTAP